MKTTRAFRVVPGGPCWADELMRGVLSVASSRSVGSSATGRSASAVSSSLMAVRAAGMSLAMTGVTRVLQGGTVSACLVGNVAVDQSDAHLKNSTTTTLMRKYRTALPATSFVVSIDLHSR